MSMNIMLCGIHREAISVILQDSARRLKILQNLCPEYFCDNGCLINAQENKEFVLPKINDYVQEPKKVRINSYKENKNLKKCSTLTSTTENAVPYGPCGKFERRMCNILDSIELAKAEITGTQAIKLPNGRIQYIGEKHIRQRKFKEDLQYVSKCLVDLIAEVREKGTFQYLLNYVNSNKNIQVDMGIFIKTEKESVKNIELIHNEIIEAQFEFDQKQSEFLTMIQHLKHQKQEKYQKIKMEYQYLVKHSRGDINELKDELKGIEKNLMSDCKYFEDRMKTEEKVNVELMMYLRNNIQNLEQSIEYWIIVYNKETKRIQNSIKHLNINYIQANQDVETLQKTYDEYEAVCVEGRREAAKAAKIAQVEAYFHKNAVQIQNWWRYICCNLSLGPYAVKRKKKKKNDKK